AAWPLRWTSTPSWASRLAMVVMSATWGKLPKVSVSSVRREAAISGRAAFLAPPIWISPLRRRPPRMRILSLKLPSHRPPRGRADPPCLGFYLLGTAASSTAGSAFGCPAGLGGGGRLAAQGRGRPRPLLLLAAGEVLTQRGRLPRAILRLGPVPGRR